MYNGVLYIVLISLFAVLFNLNKMFELETVMLEKRPVDRGQYWVNLICVLRLVKVS